MLKKIFFLLVFTLCSIILGSPTKIHAQATPEPTTSPPEAPAGSWYAPTFDEFNKKVSGIDSNEIFGERYTLAQVHWILNSFIYIAGGPQIAGCAASDNAIECVQILLSEGKPINSPILAVGGLTDLVMRTRPVSGIDYTAKTLANLHIIPEAKAQGYGFQTLEPTRILWKISRDFAYAGMVIVIIALAFMIMFRVKISPQVVITAQSALPKIAIALILVTFSYAIAGFIIDLGFVVHGLVAAMIKTGNIVDPSVSATDLFAKMQNGAMGVWAYAFMVVLAVFLTSVPGTVGILGIYGLMAGGPVGALAGAGLGLIISVILGLIILIVFIFTLFRIFWLLLKTYVSILLLTILGPFYLLIGTVSPNVGVGSWIRNLIGEMSVFVVTGILVLLAHIFAWTSAHSSNPLVGAQLLNPYQIQAGLWSTGSAVSLPTFQNYTGVDVIGFMIGFTIIMVIPSMANIVKNAMKISPFPYGEDVGRGIVTPIVGTLKGGAFLGGVAGALRKSRIWQTVTTGAPPSSK